LRRSCGLLWGLKKCGLPDAEDAKVSQKEKQKESFFCAFCETSCETSAPSASGQLRFQNALFKPVKLRVKPLIRAVIEQKCALIAQLEFICFHA
jgi:hypothetical protein